MATTRTDLWRSLIGHRKTPNAFQQSILESIAAHQPADPEQIAEEAGFSMWRWRVVVAELESRGWVNSGVGQAPETEGVHLTELGRSFLPPAPAAASGSSRALVPTQVADVARSMLHRVTRRAG